MDLLAELRNGPAEVFIALGILLLIGGVIKGGFSLFGLVDIPELNPQQSKLLIAIGVIFMLLGGVIKLWPEEDPNNRPTAHEDTLIPDEISDVYILDVLANDTDIDSLDKERFTLSITERPKEGHGSVSETMNNTRIKYVPPRDLAGTLTAEFEYKVIDPQGASAKAKVHVTVSAREAPKPQELTVTARLVDVFGDGISGEHQAIIGDQTIEFTSLTDGQFELTGPPKKVARIPFEYVAEYTDPIQLNMTEIDTIPILEHNPIQDISFSFCKNYDKKKRLANDVFEDEYQIPFVELDEFIGEDSMRWGRLYCGIKYFGPDKETVPYVFKEVGRTLPIEVEKKKNDGIYMTIWKHELPAGTSSPGWNSNFNLKLLKGEYKATFYSHRGEPIKSQEFEIK